MQEQIKLYSQSDLEARRNAQKKTTFRRSLGTLAAMAAIAVPGSVGIRPLVSNIEQGSSDRVEMVKDAFSHPQGVVDGQPDAQTNREADAPLVHQTEAEMRQEGIVLPESHQNIPSR